MHRDTRPFHGRIAAANAGDADDVAMALRDGTHIRIVRAADGSVNPRRWRRPAWVFRSMRIYVRVPAPSGLSPSQVASHRRSVTFKRPLYSLGTGGCIRPYSVAFTCRWFRRNVSVTTDSSDKVK